MNIKTCGFLIVAFSVAIFGAGASADAGTITNGGFEDGDLTGWTALPTAKVGVVQSVPGPWFKSSVSTNPIKPFEGTYFAQLITGDADVYTMLSQTFSASVGDVLSFAAYFATTDEPGHNDAGYVKLKGDGGFEQILFSADQSQVGQFGWTDWTTASYTFASGGNYQIEAGVTNAGDAAFDSQVGLDAVKLTEAPPPTNAVPEPMSLAIWSVGGVALLIGSARRRRQSTAV